MKSKTPVAEAPCQEGMERRGFFRIQDDVVLSYHLVDEAEYQALEEKASNSETSAFNLRAKFTTLDRSLRPVMNRIRERSPELAQVLDAINEKLDLLAEVAFRSEVKVDDLPSQEVNLSAGGMSFQVQKPIEPGRILQLRVLLLPGGIGIESYARVVYCTHRDRLGPGSFPYRIGVEFLHMRDEDSDLISRHVLCKEARLLRNGQGRPGKE